MLILFFQVTCPGVWLCPKGQIMVKVSTLGISRKTRRIYPKFPLQFKETFHFQRVRKNFYLLIIKLK